MNVVRLTQAEIDEVIQLLLDVLYPDADSLRDGGFAVHVRDADYDRSVLFDALTKLESPESGSIAASQQTTRARCAWTSAAECATALERQVAGRSNSIPACPIHGPYMEDTDDR
jgi:hypothetical protein